MIAKSPDAKRAGLFRCVKTYGREAQLAFKLNLTVLFITHNIAVVEYLCDRVVVRSQGAIVEGGATAAGGAAVVSRRATLSRCQNWHVPYRGRGSERKAQALSMG